jgi:hypothetical protein
VIAPAFDTTIRMQTAHLQAATGNLRIRLDAKRRHADLIDTRQPDSASAAVRCTFVDIARRRCPLVIHARQRARVSTPAIVRRALVDVFARPSKPGLRTREARLLKADDDAR